MNKLNFKLGMYSFVFESLIFKIGFLFFIALLPNSSLSSQGTELTDPIQAAKKIQSAWRAHKPFSSAALSQIYKEGIEYRNGQISNFPKDAPSTLEEARQRFFIVARSGNVNAMHNLGMIYYKQKKYRDAYRWFKKAADNGSQASKNNIQILLNEKKITEYDIDPSRNNALKIDKHKLFNIHETNKIREGSFPLPNDILKFIVTYLPKHDQLVFSSVSKQCWKTFDDVFKDKFGNDYRYNSHMVQIINATARGDKNEAALWLNKLAALTITNGLGHFNGFIYNLVAAIEESTSKQYTLNSNDKISIGGRNQSTHKYFQPLAKILPHRGFTADEIKTLAYQFCQKFIEINCNFSDKFSLCLILNTRYLEYQSKHDYDRIMNYLYDQSFIEKIMPDLIKGIQQGSSEYQTLANYFLPYATPSYQYRMSANKPEELSQQLQLLIGLKLAEIGPPFYKIKYALQLEGMPYDEPLPQNEEIEKEIEELYNASMANGVEGINPELFNKFEPYFAEQQAECTRRINQRSAPWLNMAIDQLVAEDNLPSILCYYLALKHRYGYIYLDSFPDMQPIFIELAARQLDFQPYTSRLENILHAKGVKLPLSAPGDSLQIKETSVLSDEQRQILKSLFDGSKLDMTWIGSDLYLSKAGIKVITEVYAPPSNHITVGPLFIKAKKINLNNIIDARKGAVLVAEEFDIANATFTQPHLCHLIKVKNIDLSDSTNISTMIKKEPLN